MWGYLGERDGTHPARGVPPDLVGGELCVPERDEGQRDRPAPCVGPAPLLHHPVVVGAHAEQPEFTSFASVNVWPQNRGKVGKQSADWTWLMSMSASRSGTENEPGRICSYVMTSSLISSRS